MPELPEVETIVRILRCGQEGVCPIAGRKVKQTQLLWVKTLANSNTKKLQETLKDQVVQEVGRRGKFIIIRFERSSLLIHLRMSGDLRVEKKKESQQLKHDRLVIEFMDGWQLVFNDPRKFGRAWLVTDPREVLGNLGLEPFDLALTPSSFHEMLVSRNRQLKPLLLDQTFLAGLGNIYTDEALHLARLHPLRQSASLTPGESRALLKAIRAVLKKGIQRNGASIDWVYRGGDFQNHFQVYQRQGEPCKVCGTLIQRILVGQRGTHFCPTCQVLPIPLGVKST
jgi:formamidopyrimidine-DNA glycosylase